jgi:hypothetical protein
VADAITMAVAVAVPVAISMTVAVAVAIMDGTTNLLKFKISPFY